MQQQQHHHAWRVGDKPEDHPLWQEQIELEMEMLQRGADKFRQRVADAMDPGAKVGQPGSRPSEMTRLRTYHQKLEEMVPEVARYLKAWFIRCRTGPGNPLAYPHLKDIDPYVASFIAMRTIMDSIGQGHIGLLGVANQIGMEIEYQARMDAWTSRDPDLFYEVQAALKKQKATPRHIRRVNINRFNALMKTELQWREWGQDLRRAVGFRLIDVVVQATKVFSVIPHPMGKAYFAERQTAERGFAKKPPAYMKPPYVISVDDELLEELTHGLDLDEVRCPEFLPTLIPPKRWEGMRAGGYYSPLVRVPTLIRFRADNADVQRTALQEYDSLEMPRVFSALHYIQEVPWMVNRKVLSVAMDIWDRDLGIAGISKRDPLDLPARPPGMERRDLQGQAKKDSEKVWATMNPEAVKDWKREASKVYGENARRVSKAMAVRTTLGIAEKFINREFYFPHMLDFRGRMYPIPVYLQPQGNDLSRGLLTFAKGQPLGETGGAWLAVHLANNFGVDKVSNQERIDWVNDPKQGAMWRSIAENPLKDRRWITLTDDKHHWQALAAVYEWVRFLDEGDAMVSGLPIHVDGTCNGIQHLSAMMRDEEGGSAVNLIHTEMPADIYKDVAESLQMRLEGIRDAGGRQGTLASLWLDNFEGSIPRSFTKAPVMVMPYGGTREAYYGNVLKWLRKHTPKGPIMTLAEVPETRDTVYRELVPWMVKHLWDTVGSAVQKAQECMNWIKKVASVVAETGQPIVWRTPTGFVVRHFYGAMKPRQIEAKIDGKRLMLAHKERTTKLSKREQLQGISPNFVHSMDGSANMETIIRMALDNDQPPITSIHDAYGTVAGAMWKMFTVVRTSFIWVHSRDVLGDFRNVCVKMYRDYLLATRDGLDWYKANELAEDTIPHVPQRGSLDIGLVAEADYFFA